MELKTQLKNLVPLSKVVRAAIADSYEDIGKSEELYSFWAARGLNKLLRESLRVGVRPIILHVNHNTHTATLPIDFKEETFVGIVNPQGYKEALLPNDAIIDSFGLTEEDCECTNRCERCNQPKNICEELEITESTQIIPIEGVDYTETVVKNYSPMATIIWRHEHLYGIQRQVL